MTPVHAIKWINFKFHTADHSTLDTRIEQIVKKYTVRYGSCGIPVLTYGMKARSSATYGEELPSCNEYGVAHGQPDFARQR